MEKSEKQEFNVVEWRNNEIGTMRDLVEEGATVKAWERLNIAYDAVRNENSSKDANTIKCFKESAR
ncbi:hypothetical protein A2662_01060 [Candidatus Giovannonibacteria bacterium RIFCSPHIGHO2_01_FULL_45_33]|uniref:Uncharacterized protein n=1 Tax=Candidatus Giovannonibacteria bacterium RIFCSPLOWO2_01_FULL_45_34 TaxID=1798351 RepID=A0A1F5WZY0_9BACT|nr:MAG: hypothetical protein A2662_01060 [Candidatus Giovannonibacteria bacterium RIFCSPHIGHO2_01_FULL_45_33]OGF81202.1 MAG: hypothetical protein A2930_00385 [Candidatus Giovannonibacteria bacterium RIFCSPLOWO2_01_FULL_45_34]